MNEMLEAARSVCEAVVFGNGWLAGGGVALVAGIVVAVRLSGGVRV